MLIAALVAPAILYFLVHALHDRVQGNWPSFLYPAFAIAAAAAYGTITARAGRVMRIVKYSAVPLAFLLTLAVYVQAMFGVIALREPVSRLLAFGIGRVTGDLETLRAQNGANAIVTTSYGLASWFSFYLPSHAPVVQLNERYRWLDQPRPSPPESFGAASLRYRTP